MVERISSFVDNPAEDLEGRSLTVCDVSLRDGEQTIDAAFTRIERLEVLRHLADLRIGRAQVGFAGNPEDRAAVHDAKTAGIDLPLELILVATADTWRQDADASIEAGADWIQMLVRGSDAHLSAMGISRAFVLERVEEVVSYAVAQGAKHVSAGPSFTTQSRLEFLDDIYATVARAGAEEIVVNDSMALARPEGMATMVTRLLRHGPAVRVHCHNDFGLANACALAGWIAGADVVDVAVAGLGERAGNVPVEQFVMAVERLYGFDTAVDTSRLVEISAFMAGLLRQDIAANTPVVGRNAFAQKIEMHVKVSEIDPALFEPYDPVLVGNVRLLHVGKGSGPFAVSSKLSELGLPPLEGGELDALVTRVNDYADSSKRAVPDELLAEWVTAAQ